MATVTREVAFLGRNSGNVVYQIDYDDATLLMLLVRCINNSAEPSTGTATRESDGRQISQTFPAHATTTQAIPTNGPNAYRITLLDSTRVSGVRLSFS